MTAFVNRKPAKTHPQTHTDTHRHSADHLQTQCHVKLDSLGLDRISTWPLASSTLACGRCSENPMLDPAQTPPKPRKPLCRKPHTRCHFRNKFFRMNHRGSTSCIRRLMIPEEPQATTLLRAASTATNTVAPLFHSSRGPVSQQ